MNNYFDLQGKTALVTGGNKGVGKAVSLGLAEAGADILIVSRSGAPDELIEEIEQKGKRCEVIQHDLSQLDQINDLVSKSLDLCGKIDILVNNAGVQRRADAVDFSEEDWDFVQDVNAKAVFFLCQAFGKRMLERGYGKIINLASLLSFQGGLRVPAYAASKGAVAMFTKSLSNEWASKGVNVNAVAPGYIATEMNEALIADEKRSKEILDRIPAGRWGNPEDLAGAIVFLATRAADYIHGEVLVVDGGWMGR
ncbi:2-dehydro-3-deoxy-D-gluconate 5-dehydrogenase KduD [Halobacillus naozhouensis]|uniref:2-dehydro-3-deoxy-D-gluconate 5-dehydrogenase KduD n=1 Tax=Halobacillus naozhouensis TaxID=554880 RepID=A0ABY8IYP2_9BACI|nr:2-dehydro-3-deoxy-D-gluconate 5-dehydrogenase KduD [Halobacillus naozhouensis]WFT74333.1 2-dehydro-3-deoxy-D-gluconate 5-dehydrogenase KduD [Halobacillus naozhouensis]